MRRFNPHTQAANDWFLRILTVIVVGVMVLVSAGVCYGQEAPKLPPLPDSIHTQMGAIPVVRTMTPCGIPNALGCFAVAERVIFVRDSLAPVVQWRVLWHEVWHQRMVDARIQFHDDDLSEHVVDLIAAYMVAAMLRTP